VLISLSRLVGDAERLLHCIWSMCRRLNVLLSHRARPMFQQRSRCRRTKTERSGSGVYAGIVFFRRAVCVAVILGLRLRLVLGLDRHGRQIFDPPLECVVAHGWLDDVQ